MPFYQKNPLNHKKMDLSPHFVVCATVDFPPAWFCLSYFLEGASEFFPPFGWRKVRFPPPAGGQKAAVEELDVRA